MCRQMDIYQVYTVKPVLDGHSKWSWKIGIQDQLSLNAGQKYCRMLQGVIVIKTFVLYILSGRLRQVLLYY